MGYKNRNNQLFSKSGLRLRNKLSDICFKNRLFYCNMLLHRRKIFLIKFSVPFTFKRVFTFLRTRQDDNSEVMKKDKTP